MTRTLPPSSWASPSSFGSTLSRPTGPDRASNWIIGLSVIGTVLCAVAAAFQPIVAYGLLGVMVVGVLMTTAALYPTFGTYLYVITMPFLSGVDRGQPIPLLRPNEAVLAVVMAGACIGVYLRFLRGDDIRPKFYPQVDVPLAVFLLASTIWPITSLMLRGQLPEPTDLAAILPVIKLVGIYFMVRYTVTSEQQSIVLIRLMVWPGAVVALIAILQTLKFGPVLYLVQTVWGGGGDTSQTALSDSAERGSASLGSPIAAGDVIIICLLLVFCCVARGLLHRQERLILAMVLGTGVLAAGQFSTWIAALVGFALLAWRYPDLRRQATRFAPLAGVAMVVGAPAFLGRLDSIGQYGAPVPESWLGRYDNLRYLFIPHFNWVTTLIGVSPNDVLIPPERWREVVYLESGVLDFLWVGGVPLLAAFIWLSVRVLRTVRPAIRHPGAFGACASSLEIVWLFVLVLTLIDPHLEQRGSGDLIFTLLAITVGGIDARRRT
ncbi:MAG TPA: hypothetical protein VFE65_27015 [Pseudonocardia sp.]|jgi:hypothetical protein|nr:hypothetical protein [Pseudonocardia sp.]